MNLLFLIHKIFSFLNFRSLLSVYLIDDVLASLDAHVAKHIVKNCILGLLKDKTRIVVTENRTLFYYSNQILHVENGAITTSDHALGSFESDYADTESSDDELNTPISFELSNQDNQTETSLFQVNSNGYFIVSAYFQIKYFVL